MTRRDLPTSSAALALLVVLAAGSARADGYRDVAMFEDGKGTFGIQIAFRADGDKRGIVGIRSGKYAGSLYFQKSEWSRFVAAVGAASHASAGQKIAEIDSTGGGLLRVETMAGGKLRLTRLDGPGGSYPPVVFELSSSDVSGLQKAVDDVAKELAKENKDAARPPSRR